MQSRLRAAGVRPTSNIVDVTNYVLLELGQPMHAFDHGRLAGNQIRVRTEKPCEVLHTRHTRRTARARAADARLRSRSSRGQSDSSANVETWRGSAHARRQTA